MKNAECGNRTPVSAWTIKKSFTRRKNCVSNP
jgi:hypothetical protein